ncbi:hypothetical protein Tco_0888581 [Tanacetum coccineum]
MSWFSRCSWCGGPFNGGNCRCCTNVSFRDEFVRNPDPISNDETLDFSYPPPQPQTSSLDQFHCKDPLEEGEHCQRCTCKWCGYKLREGFCLFCALRDENSFIDVPNPNSFNDIPNIFTHPPQSQYETYSCELCGNDSHHGYDCPARFPLVYEQEPSYNQNFGDNYYPQNSPSCPQQYFCCENCGGSHEILRLNKKKKLQHLEQVANLSTYPSQRFKSFCYYDDDDYDYQKSIVPLNVIDSQIPSSNAITLVLPTIEPEDSLSMGDEHLSTIPKKESDKVIKSSVENLIPILSESNDLTDYKSECDMPVCENDDLDDIEFADELAPIDPIPLGIVEADLDPEEDIRLIQKLLNDDLSPHSPEELNSEIPDAIIESVSPSSIPVKDSDSLMEEIDIFLALDDSIPPGIENDDYDSEGDVLFLKELLNDDSISIPEYESFHVDLYNVPSSPRPPEKPPDDDVYFDIEPDTRVLTTKVVDDIFDNSIRELYVHVPNILPTLPTLYPVFNTLLLFLSENEDKVFTPGILISKEEKSPHLLSHRGFKVFQLINDSESPMMIYGGDISILDVPYLHFYPP